jgi:ectoine hydroxylase-related dioxygenase (phytanoyl-CoA dioxygenase family)
MTPAQCAAAIATAGYCVLPGAIDPGLVARARARLAELIDEDERRFGREQLIGLNEWGRTRLLPNRGHAFVELLELPHVHSVIEHILGEYRVLYYNGTSLLPHQTRAETSTAKWHIDLPICTGVPQWLNVFYLLEDFTPDNGATYVIPGSQQRPFPGHVEGDLAAAIEAAKVQFVAPAGAVIVFDSTIWHAAGENMTSRPRLMVAAVVGKVQRNVRYQAQFDHGLALDADVAAGLRPLARRLLGLDDRRPPISIEEYFADLEVQRADRERATGHK